MYKNTKLCSVLCYLTWLGWAYALFKKEDDDKMVLHHLNQAFAVNIMSLLGSSLIWQGGYLGSAAHIINAVALVFHIMGIVSAAKLSDKPLPIVGEIHIFDR